MNAIVGFSNLLDNSQLTEDERRELISYINTNTESLLVLIEDILDLSLIEANQIHVEKKLFSINQLLESVYSSVKMNSKSDNVEVKLNNTLKEKYLVLKSDQYRIKQILTNLMNNALKFTEKGFVELGLVKKEDRLVFYVQDTGIGISEAEREHIFERFRKVGRKSSFDRRGAGLGLAISKSLSEILKGELSVESASDSGSTFYFSLPYKLVSAGEESLDETKIDLAAIDWSKYNLLIVEDEEINFLFLKKALKKTRININWVQNGKEAVNLVNRNQNFDLILMDIKMPEMDGYEAARIIKYRFPNQVIIAQTAYARPEDEKDFHKNGFDDYLAKPIRPVILYYILNKYLL
jgi:CheY-like chemotaxis protein